MDPISAVSFAASVVQLVHFGINTAKVVYDVYERGTSVDAAQSKEKSARLSSLAQSVQAQSKSRRVTTKEEKELVEIGKRCNEIAEKLQEELGKLEIKKPGSKLDSAKIAAKTIFKKGKIEKLMHGLESMQRTLETSLLVNIRQQIDLQKLQTDAKFDALGDDVKNFTASLSMGVTNLATLVGKDGDHTREHITKQFQRLEVSQKEQKFLEDVKASLFFPEINYREEQIDQEFDGIADSNHWIFDPDPEGSGSSSRSWDSFTDWLENGKGTYWISGKPGSGKSTLMNYIQGNPTKTVLLKTWSQGKRLVTPTFFFWNSGTSLQKSIDGLLRSLNFQLLSEVPELISCFPVEPLRTWTQRRLLDVLRKMLTSNLAPLATCLFIDGLDEFDGDYNALLRVIKSIDTFDNVKFCLSSRPLLEFEKAFAQSPMLRLQELTRHSISEYLHFQLQDFPLDKSHEHDLRSYLERMVKRLADQAEGVFLWVVLAVRTLRQGLQGMADLSELEKEVFSLPKGIEDLYGQILSRIKPSFQRDAARFLAFAMLVSHWDVKRLNLIQFSFIERERITEDAPLDDEQCLDISALRRLCQTLKTRILSHTLGLLTITVHSKDEAEYTSGGTTNLQTDDAIVSMEGTSVDLFHRSLVDYLRFSQFGRSWITQLDSSLIFARTSIARGLLTHFLSLTRDDQSSKLQEVEWLWSLEIGLACLAEVEEHVGTTQTLLMETFKTNFKSIQRFLRSSKGYYLEVSWIASADPTGIMAKMGMDQHLVRYLELPDRSVEDLYKHMADSPRSHAKESSIARTLTWIGSEFSDEHSLSPRERLKTHLTFQDTGKTDHSSQGPEVPSEPMESIGVYLLTCCPSYYNRATRTFNLVIHLLAAGANPNDNFLLTDASGAPARYHQYLFPSFWHRFLFAVIHDPILKEFERESVGSWDRAVETDQYWKLAKILINSGADIQYFLASASDFLNFQFEFQVSAGCLLQSIFAGRQDWASFRIATNFDQLDLAKGLITSISHDAASHDFSPMSAEELRTLKLEAYPSQEESELLWAYLLEEKMGRVGPSRFEDLARRVIREQTGR